MGAVRGSIWVPVGRFFGCSISVPRRPRNPLAERTPGGWDNFSLRLIYAVSTPILRQNHGSILGFFGGAIFGFLGDPNAPKSRERRGDLFEPFFRLISFLSTPQSTPILRLIYAYSTPRCGRPLLYATIYAYSTPNLRLIYATVWSTTSLRHNLRLFYA